MRTLRPLTLGTLVLLALASLVATASAQEPGFALADGAPLVRGSAEMIAATPMALALDGVDDALAAVDAPDFGAAFTVEAWVYVRGSHHAAVVGQAGGFDLLVLSDGRLEYNGASDYLASAAGAVGRNAWHHVALAYDASASPAMRLLVNGAVVASGDTGVGGGTLEAGASAQPFFAGQRPVSDPLYLHGEMDELRVWTVARTTAEIAAAMNAPLVGDEGELALYYRFEVLRNLGLGEDGADDVQDHSGNERHADGRGGAALAASSAPVDAGGQVTASDDLHEQHVAVTWEPGDAPTQFVQVLRDGRLLASVSSRDARYLDTGGDPFTAYTYCVVARRPDGSARALGCDVGRRRLKAAESVAASDDLFDDRVRLTWRDRSGYETGYQIYRDGALVATTAAGAVTYDDDTATLAGSPYTYCVVPEVGGVAGTTPACDEGSVGATLPVADVAASDGTFPNFVLVTWSDQGAGATAFRVYRDGALLATLALSGAATADDTRYEDVTATPGQSYTYCVRRLEGAAEGVDVCDAGGLGTLAAPGSVAATDGRFDDRVRVTWTDRSGDEAGYRVYRRGGSALAFDGDDYLTAPDSDALDLTRAFTIEAWIRRQGGTYIVTRDGVGGDATGSYNLYVTGSGALVYETNNLGSVTGSAGAVPSGAWAHVAVTFEDVGGGTGTARLYVNGTEVGSGNVVAPRDLGTELLIGRRGLGAHFVGEMDELRLWNVRRSRAELRTAMFSGLTGAERGLAAYFPVEAGAGLSVADRYGISGLIFPSDAGAQPDWTTATAPLAQHGTGLALALDGADDYAEVVAADAPALGTAFTLEAWVYPTADQHSAVLAGDDGTAGGFLFRVLQGGRLHVETRGGTALASAGGIVPLGQWSHVAAVREDAASDNTRLYVNGVLVALGTTAAPSGTRALQIGRMSAGQHFAGRIDDVRIWTAARTAQQVAGDRFAQEDVPAHRFAFDGLEEQGGVFDALRDREGGLVARLVGGSLAEGRSALVRETGPSATGYSDESAAPGVAQTYCVAAFTTQGAETAPVCDAGHRARAEQPASIAASDDAFEDRIRIAWTSGSSRASFFKLYRDGALLQTLPTATLQFDDQAVASGRAYTYCLATVSNEGAESAQTCDDGSRRLKAPTSVSATDDGEEASVGVTWVDESQAERGYLVYRRALSEAGGLAADSVRVDSVGASVTSVKDHGGIAGTRYHYSVTAVDAHGQSASPSDRGRRSLAAPTGLTAEDGASETRVRLTWTDQSALETGYRVYRGGTLIASDLPANANTFIDTAPPRGVAATYAVEAFQGAAAALGTSSRAEDAGSTSLLPPGTVAASDDDPGTIRLAWADQSAIESGYVLLRDGRPFQYETADRSAAVDANTSPAQGTTYTYCVRTWVDGDGDGDPWAARFGALDAGDTFSGEVCDTGLRPAPVAAPDPTARLLTNFVESNGVETGTQFGTVMRIQDDMMFVGAPEENGRRGAVYVYKRTASGWVQSEKLLPSDGADDARFGHSLDVSGDWLLVGSYSHLNGDGDSHSSSPCDAGDTRYGRVYWFERTGDGWIERQRLTADDLYCNASFGFSVAVEKGWSMVGALNDGDGSIYIYGLSGERWAYRSKTTATSFTDHRAGLFGTADYGAQVSITEDLAIITIPRRTAGNFPRVAVLERSGDSWTEQDWNDLDVSGQRQPTETSFGFAMDQQGPLIAVGAHGFDTATNDDVGLVRIYRYDSDDKVRIAADITAEDAQDNAFGKSVSIDEDHLLIGANGKAYLYSYSFDGTTFAHALEGVFSTASPSTDASGSLMLGSAVYVSGGNVVVGDSRGEAVYFDEVNPAPPTQVIATDGAFQNRTEISWNDIASNEDEYHVFRDGQAEAIAVLPAGTTTYIDLDALPGEVHRYCVQAVRTVYDDRSERACDLGWRAPDGVIQGQIRASLGGTVPGVQVCLAPSPNGAVLLDGAERSLDTQEAIALGDNMTIEFWAKLSASQSGQERTLFFHDGSTVELGYLASGQLRYTFAGEAGGSRLSLTADPSGAWDPADWTHYAIRYRDSDNLTTLFVNGVSVAQTNASHDYSAMATGRFWLGQFRDGTHPIAGQLDEVRIWKVFVPDTDVAAQRFRTPLPAERLLMHAYWPLDERHSHRFANVISESGALYLHGTTSAAPSRPGAPLAACALSDSEGSFGFDGLRYGESAAFTLVPSDPGGAPKTFLPATRTVTLSRENPVQNEVELVDMTSHTLSGTVFHEGPAPGGGTMLTECPVDGAQVTVGGQVGERVDDAGRFRATAPQGAEPVPVVITPGRDDLVLEPATISFVPVADSTGLSVRQTTQRRLDLSFAGGSCAFDMGTATITVRAENGCFETDVTVGHSGQALYLPPLDYTVQVTDVQHSDPVLRAAMLDYFAAQGGETVSLADSNQVVPVRYIGALSVALGGLPGPSCTAGDVADVPVLAPGQAIDLTISVAEDYGEAGSCPASEATVLLYNEVADRATAADTLVLSPSDAGTLRVPLEIGAPNLVQGRVVDGVDRSYQKFITAVAEVGARSGSATEWAVVEGASTRPGEQFVTIPASPTPLWVLRDPPGDASYSYLEAGSSTCLNMSRSTGLNYALGPELEIIVGTAIDVGGAFVGEGSIEYQIGAGLTFGYRGGASDTKTDGVELCFETNEAIQTSEDGDFIGADADLFIGAGLSMIFAKADELTVREDAGTCRVDLAETLAFRTDVENMFVHTRSHIENTIIPRLDSVVVQAPSAAERDSARVGLAHWKRMLLESDLTKYLTAEPFARQAGTAQLTLDVRGAQRAAAGDAEAAEAQAEVLKGRLAGLLPSGLPAAPGIEDRILGAFTGGGPGLIELGQISDLTRAQIDALRQSARAKRLDLRLSARPDETRRTISYDAGAVYEYSYTHTYDHMYSHETEQLHAFSGSIYGYVSTAIVAGALMPSVVLASGVAFPPLGGLIAVAANALSPVIAAATEPTQLGFEFEVELLTAYGFETSWSEGTTVGYVLADDDSDDSFLVHVLMDPLYGTPIFDTVAGYGSCPYEPWDSYPLTAEGVDFAGDLAPRVVPRDAPKLRVDAPKLSGVAPDEAAVFTLFMENGSPSEEARAYRLQLLNPSNPYGAILRAGGGTLGGLDYVIESGQTQELALAVERGPRRYAYDNLALSLAPQCEAEAASIDQASIADTAYVSVDFAAPCSDVDLVLPGADWTLAQADGGTVSVLMAGLDLEPNDRGSGLARVALEYRRAGTDDPWTFAFAAPLDTILVQNGLPDGTRTPSDLRSATAYQRAWTFPTSLPDGAYEVRAVTECRIGETASGRNYSAPSPGLVDRTAPEVLGTPSPQDGFLEVGDDIALTFDEPVACGSLRTTGDAPPVTLRRADTGVPIPIRAVCSGERVVLAPQDPNAWAALEGIEVEARVAGVTDGAGNALAQPAAWSFVVRRSAFGFALADVGVEVGLGQPGDFAVPLANGRTSAVAFEVTSLPDWLFASPMQGTLKPGTSVDVAFQVAPFDTVGIVRDTVEVMSGAGLLRLPVETEIRCAPSTWRVDPADYRASMSVTAQVFVGGVAADDARDQLAAFVGSEIRGLTTVVPGGGGNRASLLVYANPASGETERVRFEVWDASECRRYATTSKTLLFAEDASVGSPSQPIAIRAGEAPDAEAVALNAGWTWISTNRTQADLRVSTVFADVNAGPDDLIKSQTAFSVYAANAGWVGSLGSLAPGTGYQVYLGQSDGVVFPGTPVDPAATPIDLRSGWTWIGYTPQAGQPLADALAGLTPSAGDLIKSQTAFAVYDVGAGWVGSLGALAPGGGYQVRMTNAQTLTFAEPAPSVAITTREASQQQAPRGPNPALRDAEVDAEQKLPTEPVAEHGREAAALRSPEGWAVQVADYPHTQSVVARAVVEGDALGSEGALLAAFAPDGSGGEVCRGVAAVQMVGEAALFFLTTYGTTPSGEVLTLRLYDPATGAEHVALPTLDFVADGLVGSVGDPFVVRDAASTSVETEIPETFELAGAYPNPFRSQTRLSYALPTPERVRLVLFDVLGREVQVLVDTEQPAGHHHIDLPARGLASGVYLYRIEAGAYEATKQVVLVK